jgi:hypothetical protein
MGRDGGRPSLNCCPYGLATGRRSCLGNTKLIVTPILLAFASPEARTLHLGVNNKLFWVSWTSLPVGRQI